MNQIKGMWRDSWWLWLIFFVMTTLGCIFISWMMCIMYPVFISIGFYFAMIRYDDQGNEKKKLR